MCINRRWHEPCPRLLCYNIPMTLDTILHIWTQPDVVRLVGTAALSVILWRLRWIGVVLYPFWLLNTFIHEFSHGAAAIVTGGEFHQIVVHPNREGMAHVRGGNIVVISNAGYLGSTAVGSGLLFLTTTRIADQTLLLVLGMCLALLCLLFVRNLFGLVAACALASGLILAGLYLEPSYAAFLVHFLAIQLVLASLESVLIVTRLATPGMNSSKTSDAHLLARVTGVPALIWGVLWSLLSIALLVTAITVAYSQP